MVARVGATEDPTQVAKFTTYLQAVLLSQYPMEKMGPRSVAELRTIASALYELGTGRLGAVDNILIQHFKSPEMQIREGSWNLARRLEIVPHQSGLTSFDEKRMAAREEILHGKLKDTMRKGGSGGSGKAGE